MTTRLTALLMAFALIGAACGDDGGEVGTDVTTTTTAPTDDGSDLEPEDADPEPEGDEPAEPVELTASDIGVTETAIRVGVVFPDISIIGRDAGDIDAKFQVIADEVNANGGINGRMIELFVHLPNPLDDTAFEAACVDLVEDREVFAVVGLLVRTNADCYAGLNDTPVISTFGISADQMAGYTAVGITTLAHSDRLVADRVAALLDAGELEVGMKVAVVGGVQGEQGQTNYVNALTDAGVDVVADTLIQGDGNDLTALTAEMQRLTEVWKSSGAAKVLGSAGLVEQSLLIAYNNADIDLPMLLPQGLTVNPSLLRDSQGLDLAPFELATALVAGDTQANKYRNGEDGVAECVDRFQDASGEEVALDESRNNLGPTIVACQVLDVFIALATAAGPQLTRDSYRAVAEGFGPIEVTDMSAASLGPGKFDLDDAVGEVARFNTETDQFEPVG
ncbi:MAG: ABC transporter substrate-binding protein [Actinomycetota bacterium]